MTTDTASATETPTVFTAREVALKFRCDVETVYRWARKGQIGYARKPGQKVYRFTQQHIDDYLNGVEPVAAAPRAPKPTRSPKYAHSK